MIGVSGTDFQQRRLDRDSLPIFALDLRQLALPGFLLCQDAPEPILDAGTPGPVEVVVAGRLKPFEFGDELDLAFLEVCDLRDEPCPALCQAVVDGGFAGLLG